MQCLKSLIQYDFVQTSSGHGYSSRLSESRLVGGGSSLAHWKAIEVVAVLDLTVENWSHTSLPAEPVDNCAVWKLAGMIIFDSGIFLLAGPILCAFHRRMYVVPYSAFATVMTPPSFTCAVRRTGRDYTVAEGYIKTRYTPLGLHSIHHLYDLLCPHHDLHSVEL